MPAPFVQFIRDCVCETQKELLRLMGQSIVLSDEGVKFAFDGGGIISRKWTNELVVLIGKSVQTGERYVLVLKASGKIEFRGAPKISGHYSKVEA